MSVLRPINLSIREQINWKSIGFNLMDIELIFRPIFLIVLVLTFSISAYFRKQARDSGEVIERREEGSAVLVLRMVLALPLLLSLILYIVYPQAMDWAKILLPLWLRALAAVVAILCVPLIYWVFRSIGDNISETVLTKSDHQLVTEGPYRWVRHPLYASALLLLLSLSLVASNWFLLGYVVLALVVFRLLVIPAEEERLIEAFGEAYQEYQGHTGALAPKIF
jgi:protein-S-isoprenylcysteine O-methyltransferase Ste14